MVLAEQTFQSENVRCGFGIPYFRMCSCSLESIVPGMGRRGLLRCDGFVPVITTYAYGVCAWWLLVGVVGEVFEAGFGDEGVDEGVDEFSVLGVEFVDGVEARAEGVFW